MNKTNCGFDVNLSMQSVDFTGDSEKEFTFLSIRLWKDAKGKVCWNKYLFGEWDTV